MARAPLIGWNIKTQVYLMIGSKSKSHLIEWLFVDLLASSHLIQIHLKLTKSSDIKEL